MISEKADLKSSLRSCLYTGNLRHRRYFPKPHFFTYPVFMMFLDLDEVDQVFQVSPWTSYEKFNLLSFYRRDYFKNTPSNIKSDVHELILKKTGEALSGPVRMLTHLRSLGFCFNPLTVYYCFDHEENLKYLILDVTNTPWGERHQYVMPYLHSKEHVFTKDFHVSPFLPMDLHYKVRITAPQVTTVVHMENHDSSKMVFDATLTLSQTPISKPEFSKVAFRHAFMTYKVVLWIYFQALILFFVRRFKFYSHPGSGADENQEGASL